VTFGVVYVATNTVTGKQYVGLTRMGVATRWAQHIGKARNPKTYFHRAIAKYGAAAFVVSEYASAASKDALALLEKAVIVQLAPAYNQTNGGEVTFGRKYDDATKERIKLANTGRKWTDAQKQRMSLLKKAQHEANPTLAATSAKHLKEARHLWEDKRVACVKEAASNRVWSESSKAKLSASCMGRRYDASVIARMAESKKRKIRCDTTGNIYACRKTASAACGVGERSILRVCGGEYPSVKGLKFSYVE
jgi:group I intron endonuclease